MWPAAARRGPVECPRTKIETLIRSDRKNYATRILQIATAIKKSWDRAPMHNFPQCFALLKRSIPI